MPLPVSRQTDVPADVARPVFHRVVEVGAVAHLHHPAVAAVASRSPSEERLDTGTDRIVDPDFGRPSICAEDAQRHTALGGIACVSGLRHRTSGRAVEPQGHRAADIRRIGGTLAGDRRYEIIQRPRIRPNGDLIAVSQSRYLRRVQMNEQFARRADRLRTCAHDSRAHNTTYPPVTYSHTLPFLVMKIHTTQVSGIVCVFDPSVSMHIEHRK